MFSVSDSHACMHAGVTTADSAKVNCGPATHRVIGMLEPTSCYSPHPVTSLVYILELVNTQSHMTTCACVCNTCLFGQCVNYGCPVATTVLEPLWLDVATTDAVPETPALSSSGMC